MSPPVVVVAHGVRNPPIAPLAYVESWREAMARGGFEAVLRPAQWRSSGLLTSDIVRLGLERGHQRETAEAVALAIVAAREEAEQRDVPLIAVGHSAGVLALLAGLRHMAARGVAADVPIVALGSPHGHPIWGRVLQEAGWVTSGPSRSAVEVWNPEDVVCALERLHRTDLAAEGWRSVQVAFPGSLGLAGEHSAEAYLEHPLTVAALREAVTYLTPGP